MRKGPAAQSWGRGKNRIFKRAFSAGPLGPQTIIRPARKGKKTTLNSPRSLLRRGKLLILSNLKIRRAVNLRPALRQLFSKIVHQLWRRMVVELFGSSEGEFFLLPWREKARMRGHNRHPHLHPYIRF